MTIWTAYFFVAINSHNTFTIEQQAMCWGWPCANENRDTGAILGSYKTYQQCEDELRAFIKRNRQVTNEGYCRTNVITGDDKP